MSAWCHRGPTATRIWPGRSAAGQKDILRASGLALLPADDQHVAEDLAKVTAGKQLSPVILVRGALSRGFPLQIADGYHRVCAGYHLGENNDNPCRIAELPAG